MAQKRPRPRAPFVVTVALATAAAACGGSTSQESGAGGAGGTGAGGTGGSVGGSGGGGTGGVGANPGGGGCGANPPAIPCPATPPPEGSACPTNPSSCFGGWWGTTCYYPDPCGGTADLVMDCGGATWTVTSGALTCATCPASAPAVGAPCAAPATETCSYSKGCCPDVYQCDQGKWTQVPVSCNPPPLICPATPPQSGAPCDPCAMPGECSYDTCSALGKLTKASCVNGAWLLGSTPCLLDAGTD
ncbi:MAG: hypothetical protein KJ015_30955 [Myxococcales bacterium]|nr:hypothetical protein [Myxococcales bacterium]